MFPTPPRPVTRGELPACSRLCCCTTSLSAARVARVCDSTTGRFDALADTAFPAPPLPVVKFYDHKVLVEGSPDNCITADLSALGHRRKITPDWGLDDVLG